jgi:hypothetical protein
MKDTSDTANATAGTRGDWGRIMTGSPARQLGTVPVRFVWWSPEVLDIWWDGVFAGFSYPELARIVGICEREAIDMVVAGRELDAETTYMAALMELEVRRG